MFNWINDPSIWGLLGILIALEAILGIDNLVFISIAVSKLPYKLRNKARIIGLFLAMFSRIALLFSIAWIVTLTTPLINLWNLKLSGKDLFLLIGGIFLIYKSLMELQSLSIKTKEIEEKKPKSHTNFFSCVIQIAILDIVFSLDSVITAVGMLQNVVTNTHQIITIATIAIIITILIMLSVSGLISNFINRYYSIKILALCILILIGGSLIAESIGYHFSKNSIYFAIFFSFIVECIVIYKNKH